MDWGRASMRCGPASLLYEPPEHAYEARISEEGSRCLTVEIEPAMLRGATDALSNLDGSRVPRRISPHWVIFELRRELEWQDDLSSSSVANTIVALLSEFGRHACLEVRSIPPPWLQRLQEQIEEEFHLPHTLESLAATVGVHHVHLAREFRRRFGCTVGQYVRLRRVEFACHRLTTSSDSLAEIAVDSGFSDQSHFTNVFRALVGLPPGAFRSHFVSHPRQAARRHLPG